MPPRSVLKAATTIQPVRIRQVVVERPQKIESHPSCAKAGASVNAGSRMPQLMEGTCDYGQGQDDEDRGSLAEINTNQSGARPASDRRRSAGYLRNAFCSMASRPPGSNEDLFWGQARAWPRRKNQRKSRHDGEPRYAGRNCSARMTVTVAFGATGNRSNRNVHWSANRGRSGNKTAQGSAGGSGLDCQYGTHLTGRTTAYLDSRKRPQRRPQ